MHINSIIWRFNWSINWFFPLEPLSIQYHFRSLTPFMNITWNMARNAKEFFDIDHKPKSIQYFFAAHCSHARFIHYSVRFFVSFALHSHNIIRERIHNAWEFANFFTFSNKNNYCTFNPFTLSTFIEFFHVPYFGVFFVVDKRVFHLSFCLEIDVVHKRMRLFIWIDDWNGFVAVHNRSIGIIVHNSYFRPTKL